MSNSQTLDVLIVGGGVAALEVVLSHPPHAERTLVIRSERWAGRARAAIGG